MPFRTKYFWILIAIILFTAWGSFIAGRLTSQSKILNLGTPGKINNLFTSPRVAIRGKILKVDGNKLSVRNINNVTGNVVMAKSIFITDKDTNTAANYPSTDISKIILNRDADINLELRQGVYKVISIVFLRTTKLTPSQKPGSTSFPSAASKSASSSGVKR